MQIKGIEGLTIDEIKSEVERGAKFVYFTYCISLLVITFRRPSDVVFVRSHESAIKHGWPYLALSFAFGWWGIPWGPIYTLQAMGRAFSGKNLTDEIISELETQHAIDNPVTSWDQFNQQSN
jgi:TRAP-type C4-dicarboxylate transport system permease small subunit